MKPKNLTWVQGNRDHTKIDETSRKILAAGRKPDAAAAFKAQGRLTALQKTGSSHLAPGGGGGGAWLSEPETSSSSKYHALGANVFGTEGNIAGEQTGTSIFDPVLCELAYRWFCPPGGRVLDPFAGGSVRGIVAAVLGYDYTGVDLRPEQVAANNVQAARICPDHPPQWIIGDSRELQSLVTGQFDFVFSCPPYFNLEQYSDDPRDLSNAGEYSTFMHDYRRIIAQTVSMLREHRFTVFVVGDLRDRAGFYRNFVSDTIAAFHDAGAYLWNDAVLITVIGSLAIRVGRGFVGSRKLGKTHQNVLVFCKGDPRQATATCGPVEIWDIAPHELEDGNGAQFPRSETVSVKVSAAMARLSFNGCEPEYIRTTCHAHCCESSTHPSGVFIAIRMEEELPLISRGAVIQEGMLQPDSATRKCPFKNSDTSLCMLHGTADKPLGCIASPFTLTSRDTLIVRNRYKLLKCYNDGRKLPAYRAFFSSLVRLFGEGEARRIAEHFDAGGGDVIASIQADAYYGLQELDTHRAATSGKG